MTYHEIFDRNQGLLTPEQQDKIKKSVFVVFGAGGIGGVISEVLARSGVGCIKLVDRDVFDVSNLNRQIFAFDDTIGKYKVDVSEVFLKKINPDIVVEKYYKITPENIDEIMHGADVALLAIDDAAPIVTISRIARQLDIPLVEGWALPFGNVRVFTSKTQSLEEVYNIRLDGENPDNISPEQKKKMNLDMLMQLKKIEGVEAYYPERAMERVNIGKIPSFAPMVWLTAVLMATEALKIMLGWGKIALSPGYSLYDPYLQKIPKHG